MDAKDWFLARWPIEKGLTLVVIGVFTYFPKEKSRVQFVLHNKGMEIRYIKAV